MADKKKFERNKPHCNIGTIGHVDHGKINFLYSRETCGNGSSKKSKKKGIKGFFD